MSPDLNRLNLLLSLGRYAEGEKAAREAIAAEPAWGSAYGYLALFLSNQGHHLPAIRAARDCVGKAPHDPWSHAVRACVLNRLGRTDQALAAADEAVRLDFTYAYARCVRCEILCAEGQYRDARVTAIDGLLHHPTDEMLLHWKGWAEYRTDRLDAAIQTAKDGLRHHPDSPPLRNVLGCALMERAETRTPIGRVRDHTRAESAFREAVRLRPGVTAYQDNRRNNAIRCRRYVLWWLLPAFTAAAVALLFAATFFAADGGEGGPNGMLMLVGLVGCAPGLVILREGGDWFPLATPLARFGVPTVPLTRGERLKGRLAWSVVIGAVVVAPAVAWVLAFALRL